MAVSDALSHYDEYDSTGDFQRHQQDSCPDLPVLGNSVTQLSCVLLGIASIQEPLGSNMMGITQMFPPVANIIVDIVFFS